MRTAENETRGNFSAHVHFRFFSIHLSYIITNNIILLGLVYYIYYVRIYIQDIISRVFRIHYIINVYHCVVSSDRHIGIVYWLVHGQNPRAFEWD